MLFDFSETNPTKNFFYDGINTETDFSGGTHAKSFKK